MGYTNQSRKEADFTGVYYDDNAEKPLVFSKGSSYLWGIPDARLDGKYVVFSSSAWKNQFNEDLAYNPFQHHNDEIEDEIVEIILGKNTTKKLPKHGLYFFHTLFASLYEEVCKNNYDSVLKWIHRFGIPSESLYRDAEKRCTDEDNYDTIKILLMDIFHEIELYSFAMRVHLEQKTLVNHPQNTQARESLITLLTTDLDRKRRLVPYNPLPLLKELETEALRTLNGNVMEIRKTRAQFLLDKRLQIAQSPVLVASEALQLIIACKDIYPELQINPTNNTLEFNWRAKDAMTALWGMLAFDIEKGRLLRRCIAKGCGRFFAATRESAIYCSTACQQRTKIKRHRVSQKKILSIVADIFMTLLSHHLLPTKARKPSRKSRKA